MTLLTTDHRPLTTMATERNALRAGIFIVTSIVLMVAIIIGIKGVGRFLEPMQHGVVSFKLTDDIGGLSPGDEVRVGGAKVGVVRGVEVTQEADGSHRIVVHYSMPQRFVLHKDAIVSIQSTVTGVSVLNFSNLGNADKLAENEPIDGRPSALSEIFNAAPEVTATIHDVRTLTIPKVNNAVDKATDAVAVYRTTGQTATDLIQHVKSKIDPIIERYNGVADTGKQALANIRDVFGDTKTDFRTTVANLRDATGTVKEKLPGMMDKMDGVLGKVSTAIEDTSVALQDVKKIAANTREVSQTARQIVVTNRSKLEMMIASLKTTGDNLKAASSEIRRSPWRLLYKPGAGEMANLNLYDSARQFADGAGQLNDAASSLRDALKDPDADPAEIQKLVDKLDKSFAGFQDVEQQLWKQVQP